MIAPGLEVETRLDPTSAHHYSLGSPHEEPRGATLQPFPSAAQLLYVSIAKVISRYKTTKLHKSPYNDYFGALQK